MSQTAQAFPAGAPPEAAVILKSIPHPVILVDRDSRIEYVNDSTEEFLQQVRPCLSGIH